MGLERGSEGSDPRPRVRPKLTVTGRLSGSVEGYPVAISGDGQKLRIELAGISAAWRLRPQLAGMVPAVQSLDRFGLGLTLDLGVVRLPVLPRSHPLVWWFAPEFRRI